MPFANINAAGRAFEVFPEARDRASRHQHVCRCFHRSSTPAHYGPDPVRIAATAVRTKCSSFRMRQKTGTADHNHRRSGPQSSHPWDHIDCNWLAPSDP